MVAPSIGGNLYSDKIPASCSRISYCSSTLMMPWKWHGKGRVLRGPFMDESPIAANALHTHQKLCHCVMIDGHFQYKLNPRRGEVFPPKHSNLPVFFSSVENESIVLLPNRLWSPNRAAVPSPQQKLMQLCLARPRWHPPMIAPSIGRNPRYRHSLLVLPGRAKQ